MKIIHLLILKLGHELADIASKSFKLSTTHDKSRTKPLMPRMPIPSPPTTSKQIS